MAGLYFGSSAVFWLRIEAQVSSQEGARCSSIPRLKSATLPGFKPALVGETFEEEPCTDLVPAAPVCSTVLPRGAGKLAAAQGG